MSDHWYRAPLSLPPFVDGLGRRWTFDGESLDAIEEPEPTSLDEWPEDLRGIAFQAMICMELSDEYARALDRYGR